jgi:hypothetical protein
VLEQVPVLKKVNGKFAKKVQGTKIRLKKYISLVCYRKKVLIRADLGNEED